VVTNRTFQAIDRQLQAMPAVAKFDIGIREQRTGKMEKRLSLSGDVSKFVPMLRAKNAQGSDIYIRPNPAINHPYLLMDDVELEAVECLTSHGYHHCLLLETSRSNHQLLLRAPIALDINTRKTMERALSNWFGSDPASCDGQHYFRLAGFTNRKPEHSNYGEFKSPWVTCRISRPKATMSLEAWNWLMSEVGRESIKESVTTNSSNVTIKAHQCDMSDGHDLSHRLKEIIKRILLNHGNDTSVAEWRACREMLNMGVNHFELETALADVAKRKSPYSQEYASRTIRKLISVY